MKHPRLNHSVSDYSHSGDYSNAIKTRNPEIGKAWSAKYTFRDFLGESKEINNIRDIALKVAQTSVTVLITGESGTGKEVLAHSIHNANSRRNRPFVWVDCSSIPKDLLESELFGYEAGSFTGADKRGKKGKFELANEGTILLDEIGDMPLHMQANVLRVLQENEVIRIGGTRPRAVNLRVIAATNKDIDELVNEGKFREDLFYRLDVLRIHIPPVRERSEDVSILVQHFLTILEKKYNKFSIRISPGAMNSLENYTWPGNVRELRNIIEKTVILSDNNSIITSSDLPPQFGNATMNLKGLIAKLKESVRELEKVKILDALRKSGNNKVKAAELLGIHRSGLYQKMKKYDI